jgi:hypothetical protein
VSNSVLRTFKTCRRKWYLATYRQLTLRSESHPATASNLLGTRVHTALEAHYGYGVDPLLALSASYEAARERHGDAWHELNGEQSYAEVMVKGFLEYVASTGFDEEYVPVAVERILSYPMEGDWGGEEITLTAKLDQVLRRVSDGALMVRDFKTVGSLAKADNLRLDEQMRFYDLLLALSLEGTSDRAGGAVYTMLLRSKRTIKATPPFYQQVVITYSDEERASMTRRVNGEITDLLRVKRSLDEGADHREVAYPTPGDYCNWGCPFKQVCPMFDDGSRVEAALEDLYVQADPWAYYGDGGLNEVLDRVPLTRQDVI